MLILGCGVLLLIIRKRQKQRIKSQDDDVIESRQHDWTKSNDDITEEVGSDDVIENTDGDDVTRNNLTQPYSSEPEVKGFRL